MKLETVGDFEKVRKLLNDPKANPELWAVRTFGYCTPCNDITRFNEDTTIPKYPDRICRSCSRTFTIQALGYPHNQYLVDPDQMPPAAKREIAWLRSRNQQRRFFAEELEAHIREAKKAQRESANMVRRLAKLRLR